MTANFGEPSELTFIAEAGVNHFGDVAEALRLVDLAKTSKADIVKFQHYDVENLVHPSNRYWKDRLKSKQLDIDDYVKIKRYCDDIAIPFMCTAHDPKSFLDLEKYVDPFAIKVGSGELLNFHFLHEIAATRKPILLSTGMFSHDEIKRTLSFLKKCGSGDISLLHCVSAYPTDLSRINLKVISEIRNYFNGPIGWSDHTENEIACYLAAQAGASIIEKHITIRKDVPDSHDWKVSADPSNLPLLIKNSKSIYASTLKKVEKPDKSELASKTWAVKSAYYRDDISKGSELRFTDIIMLRGGSEGSMTGEEALTLVGKKLSRGVPALGAISKNDF